LLVLVQNAGKICPTFQEEKHLDLSGF